MGWNGDQEESGLATLPVADIPGIDHTTNTSLWKRDPRSPLIKSGPPGSCDSAMASDPKVFYDAEQEVRFTASARTFDSCMVYPHVTIASSGSDSSCCGLPRLDRSG